MLALAHTDVKDMVALMRSFRSREAGRHRRYRQLNPSRHNRPQVAAGPGPAAPVSSTAVAPATPAAQPAPLVAGPNPPTSTKPSQPGVPPFSPQTTVRRPCSISSATDFDDPSANGNRFWPVSSRFAVSRPRDGTRRTVANHDRPWKLLAGSATHLHRGVTRAGCEAAGRIGVLPDQLLRVPRIGRNRESGPTPHAHHPQFHHPRMANQSKQHPVADHASWRAKGQTCPPGGESSPRSFAKDLISYVRTFGPPDLLTAGSAKSAAATNFENQIRALQVQWDEVEKQLRELNLPPAQTVNQTSTFRHRVARCPLKGSLAGGRGLRQERRGCRCTSGRRGFRRTFFRLLLLA